MNMFVLVLGYLAIPFVFIVQPLRMAWCVYRLFRHPQRIYVNVVVVLISLFVKTLSLAMAFYYYSYHVSRGYALTDLLVLNYMIFPFIIYLMSELIARQMYRASN
ncbi:MAG: hypothetical protein OQK94_07250, partial [Gammaproteobacteria bacterium]|nr:hypothetical protein [Gammaproteobacteria bacterium]MCW8841380.1 hypothetical protein [Gammaproteobacteria bacterium]